MTKINDLSTYPNTTPSPTDHVIGTDVSNTGNDANGETVTFLLDKIAKLKSDVLAFACSDEDTALETGTLIKFRMPYAFTVEEVKVSVNEPPVGSTLRVDILEGATSIFSTKPTIDANETTSTTAAAPAVISDATLAEDAEVSIVLEQVGSTTAGAGLKVYLIGKEV